MQDLEDLVFQAQANTNRNLQPTQPVMQKKRIIVRKGKKYVAFTPIRANTTLLLKYEQELTNLVRSMLQDMITAVMQKYREYNDKVSYATMDAIHDDLSRAIQVIIGDKTSFWNKIFKLQAKPMVKKMIKGVDNHIKYNINSIQQDLSNWHIEFSDENLRALNAQEALIRQYVDLITNIPNTRAEQIFNDVMEASSRGRDISWLRQRLEHRYDMDARRARLVARDQVNKATSAISTAKQLDCGITQNIWRHSHGDRYPRQTHLEASGRVFELDKGCLINGEYIYPAEKINCTCFSVPVIEV